MVPTSWRVREGGGAMALMPWCYAARTGLERLVGRLPAGICAIIRGLTRVRRVPCKCDGVCAREGMHARGGMPKS